MGGEIRSTQATLASGVNDTFLSLEAIPGLVGLDVESFAVAEVL